MSPERVSQRLTEREGRMKRISNIMQEWQEVFVVVMLEGFVMAVVSLALASA
jgi:hypothetical protein